MYWCIKECQLQYMRYGQAQMIEYIDVDKTMTKLLGFIIPIALALSGCAGPEGVISEGDDGSVTVPNRISWTPPTLNTDGSLFNDLSTYRLYYGSDGGALNAVLDIDNEGASFTSYTFSTAELKALTSLLSRNSTHFFALTVISDQSIESSYSNLSEFF